MVTHSTQGVGKRLSMAAFFLAYAIWLGLSALVECKFPAGG